MSRPMPSTMAFAKKWTAVYSILTEPFSRCPHGTNPAFCSVRREATFAGRHLAAGTWPPWEHTLFNSWTRNEPRPRRRYASDTSMKMSP